MRSVVESNPIQDLAMPVRRRASASQLGIARKQGRFIALSMMAMLAFAALPLWDESAMIFATFATFAERVGSGQLGHDITHSGGRFLHELLMALISRLR